MVTTVRFGAKMRALAATAALSTSLGLIALVGPTAYAQDATPTAMAECVAPALPPGEASAIDATPEMEEHDMAEVAATPEAAAELIGTVADEATTEAATAAAHNVAACAATNPEGFLALLTPAFLEEQFGTSNPYDLLASGDLDGFGFTNLTTGAVYTYEDGSVSVDVQYEQTAYQVVAERWFLMDDAGTWKINSLENTTAVVDGDTAVVGVSLVDYGFEFNVASIVQPEVLTLHLTNNGAEAHEMVVFRGSDTVTVDNVIADAEGTLTDAEFIGAIEVPSPGDIADLTLVGLEPGVYVVVCFIPGPDGTPHFLSGMVSSFEIVGI